MDSLKETEEKTQELNNTHIEINTTVDKDSTSELEDLKTKIENLPPDTPVNVTINGENLSTVDDVQNKLNEIDGSQANVSVNGEDNASESIDNAKQSYDEFQSEPPETTKIANAVWLFSARTLPRSEIRPECSSPLHGLAYPKRQRGFYRFARFFRYAFEIV